VESRDTKGLYKMARAGKIKGFTGIDAPYEKPVNPEIHVRTDLYSVTDCVNRILQHSGLSGSGKSTISVALEHALVIKQPRPYFVYRLDGDNLRFGLNRDLGFSPVDRKENVRRVSETSRLFAEAGAIVIAGLISPYAEDRAFAREVHKNASLPFLEIFIDAPLATVESRDTKGLYKMARAGKIKGMTGIDAPYEKPVNPEIHVRTDLYSVTDCVNRILQHLDLARVHLPRKFRPLEDYDSSSCTAPAGK